MTPKSNFIGKINKNFLFLLEKIILFLFVFSLPFQILFFKKSFFVDSDFFSFLFYFSDFLFLILLFFWVLDFKNRKIKFLKSDIFLALFFIFIFFSLILNVSDLALFKFLKLFEFLLFYIYLRGILPKLNRIHILNAFFLGLLFQFILIFYQFASQSSFGLSFLGEPNLNQQQGIAKVNLSDGKLIRPYGTFAHPNILGLFFLFGLFFVYLKAWLCNLLNKKDYFLLLIFSLALFLSFSKTALLGFLFFFPFLIFLLFKHDKKKALLYIFWILILTLIFFQILFFRFVFFGEASNLSLRGDYFKFALVEFLKNPLFGVGIGNLVLNMYFQFPSLPDWVYQPIHNSYFLLLVEGGVFAFVFFVLFFIYSLKEVKRYEIVIPFFILILFLSSFDHYFWDIQQAQFIFWFVLAFLKSLTNIEEFKNKAYNVKKNISVKI